MIANLEEIKNLLKEQNTLLRSGQVKVIVTECLRTEPPCVGCVKRTNCIWCGAFSRTYKN